MVPLCVLLLSSTPAQGPAIPWGCSVVEGHINAATWDNGDATRKRVVLEKKIGDTERWQVIDSWPLAQGYTCFDGGKPCQPSRVFFAPGAWRLDTRRQANVILDCTGKHCVRVDFK